MRMVGNELPHCYAQPEVLCRSGRLAVRVAMPVADGVTVVRGPGRVSTVARCTDNSTESRQKDHADGQQSDQRRSGKNPAPCINSAGTESPSAAVATRRHGRQTSTTALNTRRGYPMRSGGELGSMDALFQTERAAVPYFSTGCESVT